MPSSVRPTNVARVSMLMRTDLLMNSVRNNSVDLLKVQNQLSTGLRLARPSDSPAEGTTIMHLDSMLERYQQYISNIDFVDGALATADSAFGQTNTLLQNAHSLALESIGMGADDSARAANAQMIDQIIEQMVTIGNTSYRGSYIFAGENSTVAPFEASSGGVLFTGTLDQLSSRVADDNEVFFNINPDETFGIQSSQVIGIADLNPDITADTLISDLNGNLNLGVRRGSITISDGVNSDTVDLSSCVTVGDLIRKINDSTVSTTTAAINATGDGLTVTSTLGGANLTITELGSGYAARDLGIFDDTGAGATLTGQDVDARLTPATPLTALAGGAGIDNLSGLVITNSLVDSAGNIDLSAAQTFEDVINAINNAGVAVLAEINSDGTGINVHNLLSGSEMSIGENGGTTATDLGIRSMNASTKLADLNGGKGVHPENGVADIQVTDRAGNSCDVNLDTVVTVQDVIDLINAAAAAALPPVQITADLAAIGNGIELTDSSGGGGPLSITRISNNGYFIEEELGLAKSVNANTLTGDDVNPAKPSGLFTDLIALRDALLANDDTAISDAANAIEADRQAISNMRGAVGSQMRALADRKTQLEDNVLATETLRSDIRDIDFTEAITRYQNLYTALQANLQTGSQLTNISLLDFLG